MSEPTRPSSPFMRGFRAALDGMKLAFRNEDIAAAYLKVVAMIFALSLVLSTASLWGLWSATTPAEDATLWWVVGLWVARVLGSLLSLVLGPLLAIFIVNIMFPLFNQAVFMTGLRVMDPDRATALAAQPGMGLGRSVAIPTWRLIKFLGLTVCFMILGLIPVVGTVLAALGQAWLTARTVSWELLDPYFESLDIRYAEQRAYVKTHRMLLLGFGLPISMLLAIPLLGPLFFGLAQAAGALLLARELPIDPRESQSETLPPPLTALPL